VIDIGFPRKLNILALCCSVRSLQRIPGRQQEDIPLRTTDTTAVRALAQAATQRFWECVRNADLNSMIDTPGW